MIGAERGNGAELAGDDEGRDRVEDRDEEDLADRDQPDAAVDPEARSDHDDGDAQEADGEADERVRA